MGLPDGYILPQNPGKAYKLCGDGLCVPVIRHLAAHLLEPLLRLPADELAAAE
jgi:DNA (cytosine-5)-methyltransferase 1